MPVRMSKQAMDVLVEGYEARMADQVHHPLANGKTNYRRAIELQVRQMARIVQGEQATYHALTMR
jgi:CRISPR/Cas system-associated endonuclease Cas1